MRVITSYSIHYTKLYEVTISVTGEKAVSWPYVALTLRIMEDFKAGFEVQVKRESKWETVPWRSLKTAHPGRRITSYNVCYTKLLRSGTTRATPLSRTNRPTTF